LALLATAADIVRIADAFKPCRRRKGATNIAKSYEFAQHFDLAFERTGWHLPSPALYRARVRAVHLEKGIIRGPGLPKSMKQPSSMHKQSDRYDGVLQCLHWLTALLIFTTLPIAWVMQSMPHDARRDVYVDMHKSIGLTVFLLTLTRLAWRLRHGARAFQMSPLLSAFAKVSHWSLYALLLALPLTGYIQSAETDHAAAFFGLFQIPALPHNQIVGNAAMFIHNLLRWPLYGLIAAHLAATFFHVTWRRDGILERMLPVQRHVALLNEE
jgi:cytochrome b561